MEGYIRIRDKLGAVFELDAGINRGGIIGESDPIIWLATIVPVSEGKACEIDSMALLTPH
jgi:hypothetical protein